MDPIKFKGHNMILAEDQPQYRPLPICVEHDPNGSMTSCYKLTWWERIKVLFVGRIFFRQVTFGRGFNPIEPLIEWKDRKCINCGLPIGDHKYKTKFVCPPKLN